MNIQKIFQILTLAAVLVTAASCSKDDNDDIIFGGGESSGSVANNQYTHRLEVPRLKAGNIFIHHSTKFGKDSVMNYCLEYDKSQYHSRWVAFRFDGITRQKNVSRKDYDIKPQYPADPKLPENIALEDDARFNGNTGWYDHGHLCASADRLFSREGNDQTFYMTNMSPQNGKFNSSYWSAFEQHVQDKGRDKNFSDTLYVCKGGTIDDEDNIIGYVANSRMAIPKYYFMALLKVKNDTYSAIAFYMEHKNYGYSPSRSEMAEKAMRIDQLEELTGIDFFHNLPDAIEAKVESFYSTSAWGL